MSVAFNNVMVIDQTELAVQLHEDGVRAYLEGRIADAESFFDGALKLFEAHDGTDSPDVAAVLCDLGTLAEDRRDYKAAVRAFRRATAIAGQWQNADDEDLQRLCLRAWNDLGRVLRMQNRYQQAQQISQQAARREAGGPR